MTYPDADLATARLLKALAHPARLAMVRALAAGGCGCGDIVRRLPLAQSTVSQHLKILKEAGLVEGVVEGPRASYCLAPDRLREAEAALAALAGLLDGAGICRRGQAAEDAPSDARSAPRRAPRPDIAGAAGAAAQAEAGR